MADVRFDKVGKTYPPRRAGPAVEVLRQNRGLVRQLRAARVSWAGLLGRTLRLWSPSLLCTAAEPMASAKRLVNALVCSKEMGANQLFHCLLQHSIQ